MADLFGSASLQELVNWHDRLLVAPDKRGRPEDDSMAYLEEGRGTPLQDRQEAFRHVLHA